jgi:putative CocE/NonD family hydrolase
MRYATLAAALLLLTASAVLAGGAWAATAEPYNSFTVGTVMTPMRDGVRLAGDLYRPARDNKPAEEKLPVLIQRTPYSKAALQRSATVLARRGYVVLVQDCRGRYASEGNFYPFLNEGADGYDTIEWAAAQPWSNGTVATWGGSYTGMNQYTAAMLRPPHLAAMFIQMAGSNLYQSVPYPGGIPAADWLMWILRSATTSPQAEMHPASDEAITKMIAGGFREWLAQPPDARAGILKDFPVYAGVYRDFYQHPAFDDYWKQRGFYTAGYYNEIKDVPTLFITGWYDIFLDGTLDVFTALSHAQRTEKKLIVGPWPHGIGTSECGDAYFGPGTTEDQAGLAAEWFDHLLRGGALERSGPVTIFRMGGGDLTRNEHHKLTIGGEWRTENAWPIARARAGRYYLHDAGRLDEKVPVQEQPTRIPFDPLDPAPTLGGRNNTLPRAPNCIQDQSAPKLSGRPDIVSYSSAPFSSPLEISGKVRVTLWITSSASDADFTAKLIDVHPDGYAMNVAEGQIRARYHNGFDRPEDLKPGKPYQVTIDLGSTSILISAGHRLRVSVASGNFPKLEPLRVKSESALLHDARHASYLEIPAVK